MTEHLTDKQIQEFKDRLVTPDGLLAADRHFAECLACAERLASDPGSKIAEARLVAQFGYAFEHLSYAELEALADGNSNDPELERANLHIESCESCTAELASIEELKPTAHSSEVPIGVTEPSWWLSFGWLRPVIAAMLLITAGVAVWVLLGTESADQIIVDGGKAPTDQIVNSTLSNGEDVAQADPANNGTRNEPDQELTVAVTDGADTIGIDPTGQLVGVKAGKFYDDLTRRALQDGRLTIGNTQDLRSRPSALLGDNDSTKRLELVSPLARVLGTARPTLVWRPVPGAMAYVADVFDDDFRKVASSGPITVTRWSPTLPRGRTYLWQVTAKTNEGEITGPVRPQPEARFKVLDATRANAIERLKRGSRNSDLLLAVAYAEAGMLAEAKEHLQALQRKNPRSRLVRKLLGQIR